MNKTKIDYLDYSWNPTHGCSPVSAGCENCWACTMAVRLAGMGAPGYDKAKPFAVTFHPDRIDEPLKIKKPALIGVSFMGDLFHGDMDADVYPEVMQTIVESRHRFLVLTKRPENVMPKLKEWLEEGGMDCLPENLWLGVSVENQRRADERIPILLEIPAAKRFVSYEPALERFSLWSDWCNINYADPYWWWRYGKLHWLIMGCESGPRRRPARTNWFRNLRDQCIEAGVPFFLKQVGENEDGSGKVVSKPYLDGRRWLQYPKGGPHG